MNEQRHFEVCETGRKKPLLLTYERGFQRVEYLRRYRPIFKTQVRALALSRAAMLIFLVHLTLRETAGVPVVSGENNHIQKKDHRHVPALSLITPVLAFWNRSGLLEYIICLILHCRRFYLSFLQALRKLLPYGC